MKEYMQLDQELNGPLSNLMAVPAMPVEDGKRGKKRKKLNGNTSMNLDKAVPQQTANSSSKQNAEEGGQPVNGAG